MKQDPLLQLQQWLDVQKACWQAILQSSDLDTSELDDLLSACRKAVTAHLPDQHSDLAEQMTTQLESFCRYGLNLLKTLNNTDTAALRSAIESLSQHLLQQLNTDFAKQWSIPEHLLQLLTNQQAQPLPGLPFIQSLFTQQQGRSQHNSLELFNAYDAFCHAFNDHLTLQTRIIDATNNQLLETLGNDPEISSLAQLHHLWIDAYEHHYALSLQDEEYQQSYGRLANAILELQLQIKRCWQEEYRSLGLVPYEDYRALLEQHHNMRRTVSTLTQRLDQLEAQLSQASNKQTSHSTQHDPVS